jgi:hypothetical protein
VADCWTDIRLAVTRAAARSRNGTMGRMLTR